MVLKRCVPGSMFRAAQFYDNPTNDFGLLSCQVQGDVSHPRPPPGGGGGRHLAAVTRGLVGDRQAAGQGGGRGLEVLPGSVIVSLWRAPMLPGSVNVLL